MAVSTADMIVIGGGLIGAAIAWGAQRSGAEVMLLDEGDVAHRAARGNFGLVWLQGKGLGVPPYMRWSQHAGALWPRFAAELEAVAGLPTGWRRCGGFHFCVDEAQLEQRRQVQQQSLAEGSTLGIEILDAQALREILPGVSPAIAGASWCAADAQVNPLKLLRALHVGLQAAGGVYRGGARVEAIEGSGGGFRVRLPDGDVVADKLVIAAGLGSVALGRQVGLNLPLVPERGQIVVTERVLPFFPHVSNCLQQTLEGTLLLGSSHEHAGFDEGTDIASVGRLARQAVTVFPALAGVNVVRYWGSLRVMSPDGLPIYQESASHKGAFAVTCHSGVTLASAHALELGPALVRGELPKSVSSFGAGRFDVQAA